MWPESVGVMRKIISLIAVIIALVVAITTPASAKVYRLMGDWNGDGWPTAATFNTSTAVFSSPEVGTYRYGRPGDTPLVGDWDADGRDELAAHRGPYMYFKYTMSGGDADVTIYYGRAGDTVVVGDWDQDGRDTVAVHRGDYLYVKNTLRSGDADYVVKVGAKAPTRLTDEQRIRAALDRHGCSDATFRTTPSGNSSAHWTETPQRVTISLDNASLERTVAHECAHLLQYDAFAAAYPDAASIPSVVYQRLDKVTGRSGRQGVEVLADCMMYRWGYKPGSDFVYAYPAECGAWKGAVDKLLAGIAP